MTDAAHGGPWTELDHLENLYFDLELSRAIVREFQGECESVMDVGAGLGLYVAFLSHHFPGECLGIEPRIRQRWDRAQVMGWDIVWGEQFGRTFDLVLCMEVAEHMPREHHARLFDGLARFEPKVVIFSGAVPNQDGLGHVACRPESEWMEEFTSRGFVHDAAASQRLRDAAYWGWFKDNLNVFRR